MKKCYVSPSIKTEKIEIGVFGCNYGGHSSNGYNHQYSGNSWWWWWWGPKKH